MQKRQTNKQKLQGKVNRPGVRLLVVKLLSHQFS